MIQNVSNKPVAELFSSENLVSLKNQFTEI